MKTLPIFYYFVVAVILAATLSSCKEKPKAQTEQSKVRVKTAMVKETTDQFPIRTSGRLSSKTESKLSFKTGGIIREIKVNEGSKVKAGQLLATLDLVEINSQVKQAELAFEKAKRDLNRIENLYKDSVATLENYQDATTAMEVAGSNLKIARFNLQHSQIKAPSDGKILRKLASENELVGSGMPVILFAPMHEEMVVKVNLTDREIISIEMNDPASLTFDAYPGETFDATVSQIANAADPYTGTYEVELTVRASDRKLVSGFIASTAIIPTTREKFTSIPVDALVDGKGREGYVFVVNGNKAEKRKIKIHHIEDNGIIVSEGIRPSEQVITEGAQYLDDGSEIEIVNN